MKFLDRIEHNKTQLQTIFHFGLEAKSTVYFFAEKEKPRLRKTAKTFSLYQAKKS